MKAVAVLLTIVLAIAAVRIIVSAAAPEPIRLPGAAEIVMEDLRFSPNRVDAQVGVPLTVRLTNRGMHTHDLNFSSRHMPGLEGVQSIVAPGETRTVRLNFDRRGTHTFSCSLPGHAASGMTGAVFVRP